ncbi:DUF2971 domain-containing protein [Mesorhizobium sp. PL10]
MLLYRFLNAEYGLLAIRERRLRISRINELNDEFEFIGLALKRKADRIELRRVRQHVNGHTGIICMSKKWSHPLMWSHYGASYTGIALEFFTFPTRVREVEYVTKRPTLQTFGCKSLEDVSELHLNRLFRLKFDAWQYEEEYRFFLPLENGEEIKRKVHYFLPFSPHLQLKSVIVGPRSAVTRAQVAEALGGMAGSVETFRARADFDDFKVVKNMQESMWK